MTKKIILVEAVSMFRMRYVIEAESAEHACDEVVCNHDGRLREFSQKHLDEIITSTRELTQAEYLQLWDEDNDYLASWSDDQKLEHMNRIDYEK
jgi:hypothetical protein